jgi:hypothetical protein
MTTPNKIMNIAKKILNNRVFIFTVKYDRNDPITKKTEMISA